MRHLFGVGRSGTLWEVLKLGTDPQVYAESILKVCEFYVESPPFCAAGVTGSNLKGRIEAIMIHRNPRNLDLAMKLLLAAIAAGALLAWIIHDFAGEKRKGALKD